MYSQETDLMIIVASSFWMNSTGWILSHMLLHATPLKSVLLLILICSWGKRALEWATRTLFAQYQDSKQWVQDSNTRLGLQTPACTQQYVSLTNKRWLHTGSSRPTSLHSDTALPAFVSAERSSNYKFKKPLIWLVIQVFL